MSCPLHPEPAKSACTCAEAETPEQGRARRAARMRRLAELGMRMAETLVEEAEAAAATGVASDGPDTTQRFARIARVVHQLTALEERLAQPADVRTGDSRGSEAGKPIEATSEDWACPPDVEKHEDALHIVHALVASDQSPAAADRVLAEINTEIVTHYDQIDLTHRPLGEIVAEVAQAFVLNPDWDAWRGKPWVPDAVRRWEALIAEDAEATARSP